MLRAQRDRRDVQCSVCAAIIKETGKRKHESKADHRLVGKNILPNHCMFMVGTCNDLCEMLRYDQILVTRPC